MELMDYIAPCFIPDNAHIKIVEENLSTLNNITFLCLNNFMTPSINALMMLKKSKTKQLLTNDRYSPCDENSQYGRSSSTTPTLFLPITGGSSRSRSLSASPAPDIMRSISNGDLSVDDIYKINIGIMIKDNCLSNLSPSEKSPYLKSLVSTDFKAVKAPYSSSDWGLGAFHLVRK